MLEFKGFNFADLWVWLTSAITAVVGWFAGKRKRKREDLQQQIDFINASFESYKEIIRDLRKQVTEILAENQLLEKENNKLHREIRDLRNAFRNYVLGHSGDVDQYIFNTNEKDSDTDYGDPNHSGVQK